MHEWGGLVTMDIKKQIKDIDVNVSAKNRLFEELQEEIAYSDKGITVLAQDISISRDMERSKRNNNLLVLDDRGNRKDVLIENLKQNNTSYVVVDFDGELYNATEDYFEKTDYQRKLINLFEIEQGDNYNPFYYIRNEVDVDMMIKCIMNNTTSDYYLKTPGSERLVVKNQEQSFLKILISCYMKYGTTKSFTVAYNLLKSSDRVSKLDRLFSGQFIQGPDPMECKRYAIYKQDVGEQFEEILSSCAQRLELFKEEDMIQLSQGDTLNLESMKDKKSVLFIAVPSSMKHKEVFLSMILTQVLYSNASKIQPGQQNLMFVMNHFGEIGKLAHLAKSMDEYKQQGIGFIFCIEQISQIKNRYKKWEDIINHCDTILYLGVKDDTLREYLIQRTDANVIRKKKILGKDVFVTAALKPEEVKMIDEKECICVISGNATYLSSRLTR